MNLELPNIQNLKILRRIGSGTTAKVYEALRDNGERIALKVVSLLALEDESARTRVKREVIALQTLRHPGIVQLYQFQQDPENLILELEFVDGCTLTEWNQNYSTLLVEPKLWILANLAQALAVAHMEGTIHRDLKPDNILISKTGEVKLTDFGLSKQQSQVNCNVTQPGLLVGSLAYLAPEMITEGKSSFASDIFSFGVVAYELVVGKHPFPHQDLKTLLDGLYSSTETQLPFPAHLSERVVKIISGCLQGNIENRPPSLWMVYSELMVGVQESGLQDYCKLLISEPTLSLNQTLTHALRVKYDLLKRSIQEISNTQPIQKKKLLQLINEFSLLFPNDPATSSFLSMLREPRRFKFKKTNVYFAFAAIFLLLFLGTLFVFLRNQSSLNPKTIPIEKTKETLSVSAPETHAPKTPLPEIRTGTLDIRAGSSIRVLVDGKNYPRSALRQIQLNEGSHQVSFEREGYLPIQKTIQIKKDKTTIINLGTASHEN